MSASDAAPLPRLGEVFFDVRGSSRTMRLSWYADTGVAVFSIWQGGRCTGTFRLPIDDLPRMIGILERGPEGRRRPGSAAPRRTGQRPDPDYPAGDYPAGGYHEDEATGGYAPGDYPAAGDYGPGGYAPDGYGPDGYAPDGAGPEALPGYQGSRRRDEARDQEYEPGGYHDETTGYGQLTATGYLRAPDQFEDAGSEHYRGQDVFGGPGRYGEPESGQAGYGDERFVPPYVSGNPESYRDDIAGPDARPSSALREPGYPPDSRETEGYPLRSGPEPGYSGGSEYRPAADPAASSRYSASHRAASSGDPRLPDEADPDSARGQVSDLDYWRRQGR